MFGAREHNTVFFFVSGTLVGPLFKSLIIRSTQYTRILYESYDIHCIAIVFYQISHSCGSTLCANWELENFPADAGSPTKGAKGAVAPAGGSAGLSARESKLRELTRLNQGGVPQLTPRLRSN